MNKTVIFFGKLENYPRQLFFKSFFENLNFKIIYINNNRNFFLRHFINFKLFFIKFDLIFVCWPGWSDLPFIKLLAILKSKKIIYDCFTTAYEDYLDKVSSKTNFIKEKFYFFFDKITLALTDHLITDTKQHKFFIEKNYKIKNISHIYISEKNNFYNKKIKINKKINLIFVGAFRNLHGVENILYAYKIVNLYNKNINLKLIGTDYDEKFKILSKNMGLKNIFFYKRMKYKLMINHIEESDICLGIFGNNIKAQNVISNFLITACRLNKIIITQKTEAAKEVFKNNPYCFLIDEPIVKNLAKRILDVVKRLHLIDKRNGSKALYKNIFNSSIQKDVFKKIISNYCI
jgi:glycosyltransferase involved in cell wall biosynthesis